jgi:hypothetical protein
MKRSIVLALVALFGWAAAPPPEPAPQPAPSVSASPAANSPASPTSAPTVSPTPAPPTPQPTVSATPQASAPASLYHFVYTPAPHGTPVAADAPRIVEVDITDQTLHQNSDVAMRVLTSQAVAAVFISAMGRELSVPQVAPGMWGGQSHIPSLPFFFLNRVYDIEVRASAADGRADVVRLPIRLVR